ncbi:hypothetical protein QFZ57_001156 [Arthrobacter sp. B1I2]|nr:hypothetical protein [Arthrobacter sp. B1I2]
MIAPRRAAARGGRTAVVVALSSLLVLTGVPGRRTGPGRSDYRHFTFCREHRENLLFLHP